jgi:hypothetical protein
MNDPGQLRSKTPSSQQTTFLRAPQSRNFPWLLGCCLGWFSLVAFAQTTTSPAPPLPVLTADTPTTADAPSNAPSPPPNDHLTAQDKRSANPPDKPAELSQAWLALSKRQKQALAPLSDKWGELTHQQKQKWLTLARGFFQLTDPEQMVLHGRMREWAALSPRQRAQARFNFNSTMSMPIEDKRAQWAAYQQLSDDEKNKLTSGIKAPLKSGARNTAAPSQRLVKPPPIPADANKVFQTIAPRRAVHPKTLLPHPPG